MSNRQFNQLKDFGAYIKRHLRSLKELILNCIIPREHREAIQEERSPRSISEQRKLKKTILRRNSNAAKKFSRQMNEGSHEPLGLQEF
jgi:hypothetical protein